MWEIKLFCVGVLSVGSWNFFPARLPPEFHFFKTALHEIAESSPRFQCTIAEAVGWNEAEAKFRFPGGCSGEKLYVFLLANSTG